MLTAVFRLGSQTSGRPKAVLDQSNERIRAPISPPPEKISFSVARVWRSTFPAALMSSPEMGISCLQAQFYRHQADRLLTGRNCFVVLGYEKVELDGEKSSQKSESRIQKP